MKPKRLNCYACHMYGRKRRFRSFCFSFSIIIVNHAVWMRGTFHIDYTYILLLVRHNRAITSKGHDLVSDIYFDILYLVYSYLLHIKKKRFTCVFFKISTRFNRSRKFGTGFLSCKKIKKNEFLSCSHCRYS